MDIAPLGHQIDLTKGQRARINDRRACLVLRGAGKVALLELDRASDRNDFIRCMKVILQEYHQNYAQICNGPGQDGMARVSPHLVMAMFPTQS